MNQGTAGSIARCRSAVHQRQGPGMAVTVTGSDLATLIREYDTAVAESDGGIPGPVRDVLRCLDGVLRDRPELWGLGVVDVVREAAPGLVDVARDAVGETVG